MPYTIQFQQLLYDLTCPLRHCVFIYCHCKDLGLQCVFHTLTSCPVLVFMHVLVFLLISSYTLSVGFLPCLVLHRLTCVSPSAPTQCRGKTYNRRTDPPCPFHALPLPSVKWKSCSTNRGRYFISSNMKIITGKHLKRHYLHIYM